MNRQIMKKVFIVSILLWLSALIVEGQQVNRNQAMPAETTQADTSGYSNERLSSELNRVQISIDSLLHTISLRPAGRGKLSEKIDSVQQSIDTLVFSINKSTKQIENNTFFGTKEWIGWWVAILSLIVAAITFWAQSKTEKHTQNAPISAQIGQFKDLTRHLYRNLVCTSAAIAKYNNKANKLPNRDDKDTKKEAYPSESNFNKLKTMPDDVILVIDVNENTYAALHELRVLLRNYNIEIDVASNHISKESVWEQALDQDFDNLLFKPFHLITSAFESESLLMSADSGLRSLPDRSILIVIKEHLDKLKGNFKTLATKNSQSFLQSFFNSIQEHMSDDTQCNDIALAAKEGFEKTVVKRDGGYNGYKSVKRSIDNLAKFGLEAYNPPSITKRGKEYVISVSRDELVKYLEDLFSETNTEIKECINNSKCQLLWAQVCAIIWPFNREGQKKRIKVLKSSISQQQNKLKGREQNKLLCFFKELSAISKSQDALEAFKRLEDVNYDENNSDYVSYKELYNSIRPYLTFIAQETWTFNELLIVILAVDASIEVNRIGMVNYE